MRGSDCSSKEAGELLRGKASAARAAGSSSPLRREDTKCDPEDARVLTKGSWHLCTDPNWEKYSFSSSVGKRTRLPGPSASAQPRRPGPTPACAGARGEATQHRQPQQRRGMGGGEQTHCSTQSRESQPRRCRRAAGSGAQPSAPRWPPPCRDCGEREGRREGGAAPPRPARNGGGGGPDSWGWGGCVPPALSLLSAAWRVRPAGRGGLLCAGGPGNAGLLLPAPRGERPRARPALGAVSQCGAAAVSL